ncbi:rhomboid family intramembrane serine protease [Zhouia sp. PK063]|uniref:rhomboid family intramembrane serine protease n=1 Tax=Zhouia sp. PK063 TaxID=3373602 RepID=UPI0037A07537
MMRITDAVKHLIIINVIFFAATYLLPNYHLDGWLALWFPKNEHFGVWQFVTHMFMHGGYMHIFFNMYALWAFGSPMEQLWGKGKFLFFYFSCGIGAALIYTGVNYFYFKESYDALIHAGFDPQHILSLASEEKYNPAWKSVLSDDAIGSMIESFRMRMVGASGAIYGILVAFAMTFPNAELFLIFVPIPIKAKYFMPALILMDLFSGVTGFSIFGGNIAHFAHVGGAIFGFIMAWYWKKNQFKNNRWN